MGRPIVYCSECGTSLREADFERGKASLYQDRPYCSGCRPVQGAPRPPAASKVTSNRIPVVRTPKPFAAPRPRPRSPWPWILGLGAAAGVVAVLAWALSPASAPAPTADRRPSPPRPAPRPLPEPPRPPAVVPPPPAPAAPDLDGFLGQIREVLKARTFPKRLAEIESMLGQAEAIAGPRKAEVDVLRQEYLRRREDLRLQDGLVGRWPLDEASGAQVPDVSGSELHGRAVGGPEWVEGRRGRALRFTGREDHVEFPSSPLLDDVQEGDFTIALWFRADGLPTHDGDHNLAAMGIFVKRGLHMGLYVGGGGYVYLQVWLQSEPHRAPSTHSPRPVVGRWTHYAGVLQRSAGLMRIYTDGRPGPDVAFPPNTPSHEYGGERWRIGVGNPGATTYAWPLKGAVDDVRLWSRALSADEVRRLAGEP
ncbi:MAG TPA: LamG domain-containing protein [Planctomycetota bacterium]|nr:LamG domain-containing protein [Planctomycetota bacterium]